VFNQRLFLIDDAELIEQVLVREQHKFTRDRGAILLRELVGDGLLTSDEPRHRERRRVLQPAGKYPNPYPFPDRKALTSAASEAI
jgi:cytochrome P450